MNLEGANSSNITWVSSDNFKKGNIRNVKRFRNSVSQIRAGWLLTAGRTYCSLSLTLLVPLRTHSVHLSRCQSQQAISPRALNAWIGISWTCVGAVRHSLGWREANQQGPKQWAQVLQVERAKRRRRRRRKGGGQMIVGVRGCRKDGAVGRLWNE